MGSIQCIEQAHETDLPTKPKTRYSTTRTAETVCEIGNKGQQDKEVNQHKQNSFETSSTHLSARNDIEAAAACEREVVEVSFSSSSSSPSSLSSSSSGGVSEDELVENNKNDDLKYHSDHRENGQKSAQHPRGRQHQKLSYLINFEEVVDIFLDCYLVPKFLVPVKIF